MRDFDLRRAARTEGGVDEQAGISPIHGGAEDRDLARGGAAWRDGERGVSAPRIVAVGAVPMACGGSGRFGGGAQTGCATKPRKDDAEARHKAEIERLRAVVAEITAENLELKKRI